MSRVARVGAERAARGGTSSRSALSRASPEGRSTETCSRGVRPGEGASAAGWHGGVQSAGGQRGKRRLTPWSRGAAARAGALLPLDTLLDWKLA